MSNVDFFGTALRSTQRGDRNNEKKERGEYPIFFDRCYSGKKVNFRMVLISQMGSEREK